MPLVWVQTLVYFALLMLEYTHTHMHAHVRAHTHERMTTNRPKYKEWLPFTMDLPSTFIFLCMVYLLQSFFYKNLIISIILNNLPYFKMFWNI